MVLHRRHRGARLAEAGSAQAGAWSAWYSSPHTMPEFVIERDIPAPDR
jgi:hypothetical protein